MHQFLHQETALDQGIEIARRLADRKSAWTQVSIRDRLTYLKRCIAGVTTVAADWAIAAAAAKGIDPDSPLAGEEWLVGPVATLAWLQQLVHALESGGQPRPQRIRQRNRQTIAQVFPDRIMDRMLWLGYRGEIWLEPDKPPSQGLVYRQSQRRGRLCLVLGAGNISSIAPLDALYKLFAEDQVVLLKMNPVNAYVGPFLEQAFAALRQDGWFEVIYSGAEVGAALCQHPLVDTIHLTGSHHTYDAIAWGKTPEERADRKLWHQPLVTKPITAELGCVTPILVLPGTWSATDLKYHARQVAGMVAHNASFNCAAAQVLVLATGWAQRQHFLDLLQQELEQTPRRVAYYPGAGDRHQAFLQHYPQSIRVESPHRADSLPWTLIPDVPAQPGEYALTEEAFCSVLAVVNLTAMDAAEFLQQAVPFVNEQVCGNLSCTLLVHPQTQHQYPAQIEQAIADLRYGAIGVNVWSGVIYSLPSFTWGAFPGNLPQTIHSGVGVVHNAYLLEHPQKSVLYAPFRIRPLPLWFPRHPRLLSVAQAFLQFQSQPGWGNLLRLILTAGSGSNSTP